MYTPTQKSHSKQKIDPSNWRLPARAPFKKPWWPGTNYQQIPMDSYIKKSS
jgi:hypothetical protein